jgi:L-2-hydroxyglutarate oxidase
MRNFDVIIIGAGIIGLATAYKLIEKKPLIKIGLIEKELNVSMHQTGHNSGVIHSGIYYKPGSLKALNCIKGYKMLLDFCDENNIEYDLCGKLIIAADEKELTRLDVLFQRGVENGLKGIKKLTSEEIKNTEPHVTGIAGLLVPQTGIVDYKIVSQKLEEIIQSKGITIRFNEEVINVIDLNNSVEVTTSSEKYNASAVVSCAGLYSDKISSMINGGSELDFRIIPFRGEYYQLKNQAKHLIKNLIYPVPDPEFPFLGVHFTRRMDGIVEAGPNAVLAFKKEGYKKTDLNINELFATLGFKGFHKIAKKYWKTGFYEIYRSFSKKEFIRSLQKLIPEIKENDLVKGGSGVRAQACRSDGSLIDDFLFQEKGQIINVCNAPSPGATSSLSIGETIADKVLKLLK